MELFDTLTLARLQFAFTMSFHIVFPAFTIGLASYLAVLEGLWLATGRGVFLAVFNYWKKIFALSFGMGVVSGITMSYQFGTNWSGFADKAGLVIGSLMAYEVLSAFFLEAGFLGVMLFGMKRVGPALHFFATLMVAVGTLLSAFWILSANSWMQTPTGYAVNAVGQFAAADWWAVIFNPSFPYRLIHMVLAAYLTTAFAVGAVPGRGGAVRAVLHRPWHQLLSLHRPPHGDDLVGRRTPLQPAFPPGRCRHPNSADPCLHGLVLLGVSRQARSLRGLPLMAGNAERRLLVRLAWFAALWLAGVTVLAMVALLLRAVL